MPVNNRLKILRVNPLMTEEECDLLKGKPLTANDCKTLIDYNVDLYDLETGIVLAKFRKRVIPGHVQVQAYENLLSAAKTTDSRATAAGDVDNEGKSSRIRVKKDGTASKQTISKELVNSGVVGYYDRSARFPYCRLTAFTHHQFKKFVNAYGIIKIVDDLYKKLMPKPYALQRAIADNSSKDFIIPGTAFSTVTVNRNYETAVHKDSGDFKKGFGNLVAMRKGNFSGCYLTLVKWGVGFDLQNGDVLLMDVHQWHGNTPMVKHDKDAIRLSLIMYYRENIKNCGTLEQEVNAAKTRKRGTKLM